MRINKIDLSLVLWSILTSSISSPSISFLSVWLMLHRYSFKKVKVLISKFFSGLHRRPLITEWNDTEKNPKSVLIHALTRMHGYFSSYKFCFWLYTWDMLFCNALCRMFSKWKIFLKGDILVNHCVEKCYLFCSVCIWSRK